MFRSEEIFIFRTSTPSIDTVPPVHSYRRVKRPICKKWVKHFIDINKNYHELSMVEDFWWSNDIAYANGLFWAFLLGNRMMFRVKLKWSQSVTAKHKNGRTEMIEEIGWNEKKAAISKLLESFGCKNIQPKSTKNITTINLSESAFRCI